MCRGQEKSIKDNSLFEEVFNSSRTWVDTLESASKHFVTFIIAYGGFGVFILAGVYFCLEIRKMEQESNERRTKMEQESNERRIKSEERIAKMEKESNERREKMNALFFGNYTKILELTTPEHHKTKKLKN